MDIVFLHGVLDNEYRVIRTYGPYQAAWYLRDHGYTAQVIDFANYFSQQQLQTLLDKFVTQDTKVFGWSYMGNLHEALWWQKLVAEQIIPTLKRKYPNLKIVIGGAPAYDLSRLMRNSKIIDRFFFGFAEDTLLAYMDNLCKAAPPVPFELLDGNKIIRETSVEKKFNICESKHRWHKNDCIQPNESLPLETGRGCIFKCRFCRFPNIGKTKNDYVRSMEELKNEMIDNYNNWGVTNYYMMDETFNDTSVKVETFCKMVSELPFKINYWAHLRIDLLWANPGHAELLEHSGLASCFFGIESFNEEASMLINKGWSAKHGKEFLKKLWNDIWDRRITFRLGMIAGLPPDTKESCEEYQKWLIENEMPDWRWFSLFISRDISGPWTSEFDRNSEKYGFEWILDNGKPIWKTKYMNEIDARNIANKLNSEALPHRVLNSWTPIERASLGYDIATDKFTKEIDIDKKLLGTQKRDFFNRYYNDLVNINV